MNKPLSYRPDIDGLRAIAVLAVIANHLPGKYLASGYLGVDVFFVISGFVVTSSVLGRPANSLGAFYSGFLARRIRRLWPALMVCVGVTGLLVWLLDPLPERSLKTGAASLFGLSNLALLQFQTDYFALSTRYNAFTHTWSLGVEEQFYIVFPFILWLAYLGRENFTSRTLAITLAVLGAASLYAFCRLYSSDSMTAYFLMPTRFWQLGAGALAYLLYQGSAGDRARTLAGKISPLALPGLLIVFCAPPPWAVPATIAAALLATLLLLAPPRFAGRSPLGAGPVVYTGRISYSLYLWHWPVVSLGALALPQAWQHPVLYLATMGALACASYHLVETPLRKASWTSSNVRDIAAGLAASLCLGLAAWGAIQLPGHSEHRLPANYHNTLATGTAHELTCVVRRNTPLPPTTMDDCTVAPETGSGAPTLWTQGDSHAGHLQGMLYALQDREGLGVHMVETLGPVLPTPRANQFPQREEIDRQIRQRMRPGDIMVLARLYVRRHPPYEPLPSVRGWAERVTHLADELASHGVAVVVVGPPPMFFYDDVRDCLGDRRAQCAVERRRLESIMEPVMDTLRRADDAHDNLYLFDAFSALCPPAMRRCEPFNEQHFLYRDADHLNVEGSALLARPFLDFLHAQRLLPPPMG